MFVVPLEDSAPHAKFPVCDDTGATINLLPTVPPTQYPLVSEPEPSVGKGLTTPPPPQQGFFYEIFVSYSFYYLLL